jgi:hypothetical protein
MVVVGTSCFPAPQLQVDLDVQDPCSIICVDASICCRSAVGCLRWFMILQDKLGCSQLLYARRRCSIFEA